MNRTRTLHPMLHGRPARRGPALAVLAPALALAPAVALLAACAGLKAGPAGPEPSLPAERVLLEGPVVTLDVVAGEVRVEPGSGFGAVVTVTRVGADAARLRLERDRPGGRPRLRVLADTRRLVYPGLPGGADSVVFRPKGTFKAGSGGFLGLFTGRSTKVLRPSGGGGSSAHAEVRVELPVGTRLDLQLGAGRLVVGATAGEVHGSTIGGATEAAAPTGRVSLSAHAGGISARGGAGELHLDSRGGAVDVSGFRGSVLVVKTGAGGITGSALSASAASFRAGAGDITLEGVRAARLELRSGAGELRLRDASADTLLVRTGVGDIRLQGVHGGSSTQVSTGKGRVLQDTGAVTTLR